MFEEQLRAFADKTKDKIVRVHRDSFVHTAQDMVRTQPSSMYTGGTFEVGKVPVLTGALVGTAEARIDNVVVATGVVSGPSSQGPDFASAFRGFQIGDVLQANFTQPYGPNVEYGIGIRGGRFFVREAVINFPVYVALVAEGMADE